MQPQKTILDSGEVAGVTWQAMGISPACGFELTASIGSIECSAFSVHPLLLKSPEARQQLALELVLPAIANKLELTASTVHAAAESTRALPVGTPAADAARRVADRWVRLRAAANRQADDWVQNRGEMVAAVAA